MATSAPVLALVSVMPASRSICSSSSADSGQTVPSGRSYTATSALMGVPAIRVKALPPLGPISPRGPGGPCVPAATTAATWPSLVTTVVGTGTATALVFSVQPSAVTRSLTTAVIVLALRNGDRSAQVALATSRAVGHQLPAGGCGQLVDLLDCQGQL